MAVASRLVVLLSLILASAVAPSSAFVFTLLRNECFKHFVTKDGETIHASFVVIKQEFHWGGGEHAKVDLKVHDSSGYLLRHVEQKSEESFTLTAARGGFLSFCFSTGSPVHESIAFDVHAGQRVDKDHMAKDDQIDPLVSEVQRLSDEVWSTQHEIHYSFYLAEQHANIDKVTSQRVIQKAVFQALALIGCALFQVYLLHQLFDKKLKQSRV